VYTCVKAKRFTQPRCCANGFLLEGGGGGGRRAHVAPRRSARRSQACIVENIVMQVAARLSHAAAQSGHHCLIMNGVTMSRAAEQRQQRWTSRPLFAMAGGTGGSHACHAMLCTACAPSLPTPRHATRDQAETAVLSAWYGVSLGRRALAVADHCREARRYSVAV